MTPEETLLDYRRRVGAMYARVRDGVHAPAETCAWFRRERDELFRAHPQSALSAEQREQFTGLRYYPYDPAYRLTAAVAPVTDAEPIEMVLAHDGQFRMQPFGQVHFTLRHTDCTLTLYWILGYGGGIFLPFKDTTSGTTTYGGGRYLLDTIKLADLGYDGEKIILDFNFAYNPSCAYDDRWFCPLSPPENRLPVAIEAGEYAFHA